MTPALVLLACVSTPCLIENVRVEVGDGRILERAHVLIYRGRISAVGPTVSAPPGATKIDGKGKVLTPGLIAPQTLLGLVEVNAEPSTTDHSMKGMTVAPAFRVADGFNPRSVWIPITREEGITSAIIAPTGGLLSGSGSWVDLMGTFHSMPDPSQPVGLFGALGISGARASGGARGAAFLKLREAVADARWYGRNKAAVEQNRSRPLSLPPLHLEALQPALAGKIPFVLEVHRASDILATLDWARAEKVSLVVAGGTEAWLVADRLAAAKVPVIITPSAQQPASFEKLAARDDVARWLASAKVPLILSASDGNREARRLRQEAGIAVAYGLAREEALRAITLAPAEAFGRGAQVGSIAVGKRANLVLWSGDPFELSTVAERVFIDGVEQSRENRQRKLVERYLQ